MDTTNFLKLSDILQIETKDDATKKETVEETSFPSTIPDLSLGNIVYVGEKENKEVCLILRRFTDKNKALVIRLYPGKAEKRIGLISMETENNNMVREGFQYAYTDLSEIHVINEDMITERISMRDPFISAPILNSFMNQCHIDDVRKELKKENISDEEFQKRFCQPSADRMEVMLPLARYAKTQKERADLASQNLNAAQKAKQKMKKDRDAMEKELRQFTSSKKSAQKLIKEKAEKVRIVTEENGRLQNELSSLTEKYDQIAPNYKEAIEKLSAEKKVSESVKEQLANTGKVVEELRNILANKEQELSSIQRENKELKENPVLKPKTYFLTPKYPDYSSYADRDRDRFTISLSKDMQKNVQNMMQGIPEYLLPSVYEVIFQYFMEAAKQKLVNLKVSMDISLCSENKTA